MKTSQFQKYELRSFEKEVAISKEAQYKSLDLNFLCGTNLKGRLNFIFYTIWSKKKFLSLISKKMFNKVRLNCPQKKET